MTFYNKNNTIERWGFYERNYILDINFDTSELTKFNSEDKIKILKYIQGNVNSHNRVIRGDALDAISSLVTSENKFEIIIIDPPHSDAKAKGKYKDQWQGSGKDFVWAGESHDSYMNFLYPRLILGKQTLTEDGVILLFASDRELPFLRLLMNKVFGEGNYVGTVVWDSNSNQQKSKPIDRNHEYVLIYSKNIQEFSQLGFYRINKDSFGSQLLEKAQSLKENGKEFSENETEYLEFYKVMAKKAKKAIVSLGNYKYITADYFVISPGDAGAPDGKNRPQTKLLHPLTKKECPIPREGKGWAYSQEYLDRIASSENLTVLRDGRVLVNEVHDKVDEIRGILFGKDETTVPNSARAFSGKSDKRVLPTTGWSFKSDKKEGINPKLGFDTVKPVDFITELILNYPNKKARVLDYFAGSGTTAVAVKKANKEDNGKRVWTLIELNENTVSDVLIPKLKYFKVKDYKELCSLEIDANMESADLYFKENMTNHIQSQMTYKPLNEESALGYSIVGVDKATLILVSIQKEDTDKSPRPSVFSTEIQSHIEKHNCNKVSVNMVGTPDYIAAWDVLIKDTMSNNTDIDSKNIKVISISSEIKTRTENLTDSLSQYETEKRSA